jgi:hypothetical protein
MNRFPFNQANILFYEETMLLHTACSYCKSGLFTKQNSSQVA